MKNGRGAILVGISILILVSCAGSPEPDFDPEIGIDIVLEDAPKDQTDGQADSSAPERASDSGAPMTGTEDGTTAGRPESDKESPGLPPPLTEPPPSQAGPPVPAEGKTGKAEKGAAEESKKPESSKPRLKGFDDNAGADHSKAFAVPDGSAGPVSSGPESAVVPAEKDGSALPPPNPLLTDSQAIRPSATSGTGEEKAASEPAVPSAPASSAGVPAKPAEAAAAIPGAVTPAQPAAGSSAVPSSGAAPAGRSAAAAVPPAAVKAPAPAAAVPAAPKITPASPAFSNPLKDPAAAAAAPSRLLDSPGEFTVTLAGQGWIFRSDLSTPGSWRFLERIRKGDSSSFRFQFTESGEWSLVFERQDPSSGGSERQTRLVRVGDNGGTTVSANGPIPQKPVNPISGELPQDPESRNAAAEEALANGDIEGALEFWERDAADPGPAGRRARKAIVEIASASGSIKPLITWLPAYIKDGPEIDTLAAALKVFETQAGYDRQIMAILDILTGMDQSDRLPEWLYLQASILEKPGPDRDLDRAAMLYQQVITQWPLSSWRDLSEERLTWLKRHYFRVR